MIKLKNKYLLFIGLFLTNFISLASERIPVNIVFDMTKYQQFEECNVDAGGYVGRVINRLVCTTSRITGEMMYNLSLTLGILLLVIVIIDLLQDILMGMTGLSIGEVMQKIISKSITQIIVLGALLIPVGTSTTIYGAFINVLFRVFNGIGFLFWIDSVPISSTFKGTIGEVTEVLLKLPIDIVSNSVRISSIFAIFTAIPTLIIGMFILYKIIAVISHYISTVFEFLVLGALSMFYLIFYLFSATKDRLGNKAISLIVTQGIKLSIVTGMIGIIYSVMRYIQYESDSFWWLFSIATAYTIFDKVINSVNDIAYAIVQGGGLGTSSNNNFMGMLGTVVGATAVAGISAGLGGVKMARNFKAATDEGLGVGGALSSALGKTGLGRSLKAAGNHMSSFGSGIKEVAKNVKEKGISGLSGSTKIMGEKFTAAKAENYFNYVKDLKYDVDHHGDAIAGFSNIANASSLIATLFGDQQMSRIINNFGANLDKTNIDIDLNNHEGFGKTLDSTLASKDSGYESDLAGTVSNNDSNKFDFGNSTSTNNSTARNVVEDVFNFNDNKEGFVNPESPVKDYGLAKNDANPENVKNELSKEKTSKKNKDEYDG